MNQSIVDDNDVDDDDDDDIIVRIRYSRNKNRFHCIRFAMRAIKYVDGIYVYNAIRGLNSESANRQYNIDEFWLWPNESKSCVEMRWNENYDKISPVNWVFRLS